MLCPGSINVSYTAYVPANQGITANDIVSEFRSHIDGDYFISGTTVRLVRTGKLTQLFLIIMFIKFYNF